MKGAKLRDVTKMRCDLKFALMSVPLHDRARAMAQKEGCAQASYRSSWVSSPKELSCSSCFVDEYLGLCRRIPRSPYRPAHTCRHLQRSRPCSDHIGLAQQRSGMRSARISRIRKGLVDNR
jgi:hypothetical protein